MAKRYFEDYAVGDTVEAGGYRVTSEEIVEFARRYDPVPVHVDEAAARDSMFGGLVASGIHTIAVWNRLRKDAEDGLVMLAGLGIDELRYPHPVRPDDVPSMRSEVIEISPSARKPDRAVMRFRQTVTNQDGVEVMTAVLALLVAGRP